MMEELVRSSMTPVSESTSPHPGDEASLVAPSREPEANPTSQNPEEIDSIPPKGPEESVTTEAEPINPPSNEAEPINPPSTEAPVDAEAFFSQEASGKVKSD